MGLLGQVPYHVIEAASLGNAEAIQEILDHYDSYIRKLSASKMIDEWDAEKQVTDTYLYEILRVHLVTAILKFDVNKYR